MTQKGRTRQELIWKKNPKTIQFECSPMQKNTQNLLYSSNRKNKHPGVQTKRDGKKDRAFEKEKESLVFIVGQTEISLGRQIGTQLCENISEASQELLDNQDTNL